MSPAFSNSTEHPARSTASRALRLPCTTTASQTPKGRSAPAGLIGELVRVAGPDASTVPGDVAVDGEADGTDRVAHAATTGTSMAILSIRDVRAGQPQCVRSRRMHSAADADEGGAPKAFQRLSFGRGKTGIAATFTSAGVIYNDDGGPFTPPSSCRYRQRTGHTRLLCQPTPPESECLPLCHSTFA